MRFSPTIVRDATDEYFSSEDVFGQWLDDGYDFEIGNDWKWESVSALFTAWTAYATQANEEPGTIKAFSEQMQARGFTPCRKGHAKTRAFAGIRSKRKNGNDINMTVEGCGRMRPCQQVIHVTRARVTVGIARRGRIRRHGPAGGQFRASPDTTDPLDGESRPMVPALRRRVAQPVLDQTTTTTIAP